MRIQEQLFHISHNIIDCLSFYSKLSYSGFGFITFEKEETMKDLIKKGKETIGEHEIDLKKATPRADNFFGQQGGGGGGWGDNYG